VDRLAKGKKISVSRADSIRVLLLVIVVAGVPILGTVFVTTSTSEPGLSELIPIRPRAGEYLVLDWSALLQNRPRVSKTGMVIPAGAEVQALGYMMDGDRSIGKNQWVQDFILLPRRELSCTPRIAFEIKRSRFTWQRVLEFSSHPEL